MGFKGKMEDDHGSKPVEVDVIQFLAKGYTNIEIGKYLSISKNTVAKHIHSILSKTGSANRAEAVRFALEQGLLEDRFQ